VYLSKKVNPRNKVLIPCQLNKPNPKCYVCSEKREVSVKVHLDKMTVKIFEDKILKGDLVSKLGHTVSLLPFCA
jgi:ubiquitin-like 1-activating enzyme E1 B